jgi:hypothetical protein
VHDEQGGDEGVREIAERPVRVGLGIALPSIASTRTMKKAMLAARVDRRAARNTTYEMKNARSGKTIIFPIIAPYCSAVIRSRSRGLSK